MAKCVIGNETAKEELCRRENILWNLIHDVDIRSVELGQG